MVDNNFMFCRAPLFGIFVIYLTLDNAGLGQSSPAAQTPVPPPLPFTTQMKKTVVFIRTDCRHVATPEEAADPTSPKKLIDSYSGTGFLVGISDKRLAKEKKFSYLVTNRHVVQPGIEDDRPCEVMNHFIRLNLKSTDQGIYSKLIELGSHPGWEFPTDHSIDLAAIPAALDPNTYDFELIPDELIATQKIIDERRVVEGDPVVFSGLFVQYVGQTKMEPIVRMGTLAMLPGEPLFTTLKKPGKVYLAEAHVFAGNSGSPMFINLGGMREGGFSGYDYKLLGVVSGEVFETQNLELKVASSYQGNLTANSGISMIVPADQVASLLNSQSFQAKRDAVIAAQPKL